MPAALLANSFSSLRFTFANSMLKMDTSLFLEPPSTSLNPTAVSKANRYASSIFNKTQVPLFFLSSLFDQSICLYGNFPRANPLMAPGSIQQFRVLKALSFDHKQRSCFI